MIHKCTGCGGRGHHQTKTEMTCTACNGAGRVRRCFACGVLRTVRGFVRELCAACVATIRAPEDKRDALADGAFA